MVLHFTPLKQNNQGTYFHKTNYIKFRTPRDNGKQENRTLILNGSIQQREIPCYPPCFTPTVGLND